MKRSAVAFALGVFFTLLIGKMERGEALPWSGDSDAHMNGDVNGDKTIDVSDALYILLYLFADGPPPHPIAGEAELLKCEARVAELEAVVKRASLPATGQTVCYSQGREVPCAAGEDGYYRAGCNGKDGFNCDGCPPEAGRFIGDETIIVDQCTALMWQKDTADVDGDGASGPGDASTWEAALSYCEQLELGGMTDWRLPNVRELQSIVDYGRTNPSIDPAFGAGPVWYWTSSTHGQGGHEAWAVYFFNGEVDQGQGAGPDLPFVRAVRNRP